MRRFALLFLLLVLVGVLVATTHDVELRVSPEDANAARRLMANAGQFGRRPANFAEEVGLIRTVQDRVLDAAPVDKEIPEGKPRELANLIMAGHGLCFDRSRAIETVLRLHGMETRHAAIYSEKETGSALRSLMTPGVESHAISEVKTQRGWMIVDSNVRWIGLTRDNHPIALAQLRENPSPTSPEIYHAPFTWVYGLYSRHGRFYRPYNAVPDVNWKELAENL